MPIREEHQDLFGNESSGVYTNDKAVTSSAVASSIVKACPGVALSKIFIQVTEGFSGTSANVVIKLQGAKALSSGSLASAVTLWERTILTANLTINKVLVDEVLPEGYEYYQVTVTPDTDSSHAYTAGKVFGNVQPIFN